MNRTINLIGIISAAWLSAFLLPVFGCPNAQWSHRAGTPDCFYFGADAVSWDAARDKCRLLGGDLTDVHGAADLEFLKTELVKTGTPTGNFWTSLSFSSSSWTWSNSDLQFVAGDLGARFDPSRDAGFLDTLPLYNEKTARGYLYYTKLYDYAILLPHVRAEYYSFGYICKAGN